MFHFGHGLIVCTNARGLTKPPPSAPICHCSPSSPHSRSPSSLLPSFVLLLLRLLSSLLPLLSPLPPPAAAATFQQYHNRARNYFKITQIAWDTLQAQPANMSPSAAAAASAEMVAAMAATAAANAAAAASSKAKSSKRRPSSSKAAAAAAAAAAQATTAAAAASAAAAIAAGGSAAAGDGASGGTAAGTVVPAGGATGAAPGAEPVKSKSHPYQTKPGIHAKAVHEMQLLSRPKTVRVPGAGVRKDLLTGTTKVLMGFGCSLCLCWRRFVHVVE